MTGLTPSHLMARSKGSKKTSTRTKAKKRKKAKKNKRSLPKSLRKGDLPSTATEVMTAGLGALREAQSTGSKQFRALVERGREVQASGSDAAREAIEDVDRAVDQALQTIRSAGEAVTGGVQDRVESVVEGVMQRLGIPRRTEVVELQARVDALAARLGGLASSTAPARTTFAVRKHGTGWAVCRADETEPAAVRSTKKQALFEARALARSHTPSELAVYKLDGTLADTTTYGE